MYENLIQSLRHCVECDHQGCATDCQFGKEHPLNFVCRDYLLREAADAIETLNEFIQRQLMAIAVMSKPHWTPVTEQQLPDYDEDVLVYANGLIRVWDRIKTLDDVDYWEDEYGYWVDFNDVDYWMPLPESP